jgi:RNA polymerase sigma factor (sigma-70 family)
MGAKHPVNESDEFGDGCVALINGCAGYDPHRKTRFSTYASIAIRNGIVSGRRQRAGMGNGGATRVNWRLPVEVKDFDRLPGRGESPVEAAECLEMRDRLWAAMTRLSYRDRWILCRRFWGGLTISEIGLEIGIPRTSVNASMIRAIRLLRNYV